MATWSTSDGDQVVNIGRLDCVPAGIVMGAGALKEPELDS